MNKKQSSENLQKDLEEKTKLAEERLNQLKYLQADFDNYKKKFEKEKENIGTLVKESLIKEFLVIIDEFERGIHLIEVGADKEGLILLYKKFLKILNDKGLRKIESLGKKFDTHYHEVVSKEKADKEEGTILKEIQSGYMLNSRVIRYSKVKIAADD